MKEREKWAAGKGASSLIRCFKGIPDSPMTLLHFSFLRRVFASTVDNVIVLLVVGSLRFNRYNYHPHFRAVEPTYRG